VEGLIYINCNKNNTVTPVRLALLAPDLTMADFFGRRIEFHEMVLGKKIGDGGSASVFKADWNGKQVAVKKLKQISGMDASGLRVDTVDNEAFSQTFHEFRREAYIMSGLSHPNLVQFEGLCLSPLCIVMEYMPGGNLYELLHIHFEEPLNWRMRIKIASDVATGMAYLHRGSIIHRDLKSPNVLIVGKKDSIAAKVTDFGLSGLSSIMSGRAVVNPVWLAPEVLRNVETADITKIDVYAFGVIMYEIAARIQFFGDETFMTRLEEKVIKGERPPIPSEVPSIVASLIEACWDNDPLKRPTFSKICDDLVDIKSALKHGGMITEKETYDGETVTPQGPEIDIADSSDEERTVVRRTKSDTDVIATK